MTPVEPKHSTSESMAHAVHVTMHFLRVARRRKAYIFASLAVCSLLGALYYTAATPRYEAKASVLLIPSGHDSWNASTSVDGGRQALIPTYEQLFCKDVVLIGAIKYLKTEPRMLVDFEGVPPDQWTGVLGQQLSASRTRRTNLIEVSYRSKKPRAAEAVVQAVVRSYLDFMERNHRDVSTELVKILDRERTEVAQQLMERQQALLNINRRLGDLGLSEKSDVVHPAVQRVIRLNETLIETQQQRLDLQATLATIQLAIAEGRDLRQHLIAVQPVVGRELLMSTMGLTPQTNEIIGQTEQKLIDDRARLDKLSRHLGPAHPDILELRQVIQQGETFVAQYQQKLQGRLDQMTSKQLGPMLTTMLQQRLEKTQALEQQLVREYQVSESAAIKLTDRKAEAALVRNEVRRLQQLHDTLLNRIAGIDINQDRADVRVTVVNNPIAGDRPVAPKLSLIVLLCLIGGIGLGCSLVYVLDLLDDRFQTPEEMQQQLDLPVLAMVRPLTDHGTIGLGSVAVYAEPDASENEAFRTLRTALQFSGRPVGCLGFTSTEPGDGKTTVLASLGVTFAMAGKRTLLIDADLRRPGLSRRLKARTAHGVADILSSAVPIDQLAKSAVQSTQQKSLDILPAGPRPLDPAELLGGPRFSSLLAWATDQYDQILIDCPPLVAASDAAVIGRQSDGVVVVVQPDKNPRRLVLRAVHRLRLMQAEVVGVVANRISAELGDSYYGLGDGYGYDDAYGHTGPDAQPAERAAGRPAQQDSPPESISERVPSHGDNEHENNKTSESTEPETGTRTVPLRRRVA